MLHAAAFGHVFPDTAYRRGSIHPGAIFSTCTDGVTEAMDLHGEQYGRDRFSQKGLNEDDGVLLVLKSIEYKPGRLNGSSACESLSHFSNAHDDDADVVLAAMIICKEYELIRARLCVRRLRQNCGDFGILHHAGQSVGAKQQDITARQQVLRCIQFYVLLHSQGTDQYVLHLTQMGFFRSNEPTPDLFGNQSMIGS